MLIVNGRSSCSEKVCGRRTAVQWRSIGRLVNLGKIRTRLLWLIESSFEWWRGVMTELVGRGAEALDTGDCVLKDGAGADHLRSVSRMIERFAT